MNWATTTPRHCLRLTFGPEIDYFIQYDDDYPGGAPDRGGGLFTELPFRDASFKDAEIFNRMVIVYTPSHRTYHIDPGDRGPHV